ASAHRHHSRTHHFRARTEHFGGVTKADSSTTTQPTTPTAPTTTNVTVASLTNGVLTLTLADGSTVSGKVTDDTEVVCSAAARTKTDDGEDNGGGSAGDRSGDGGGDQGGPGDDNGGGDDQASGDDQGGPSCGLADLLPNAVVLAAELRFTSAGAEWERIELG
ncbi:MAG: hypothetical protein ACRDLP_03195, partial [Solirubrobacteraceae bacterium]